ncbi:type I polyketide synthase, partial [Rhizomonospora bruguierae]|uniref:type I polyketide synthase n=1 Tax=Rhizomonospora bruguierae TaxID=1581705 RepID=UPI001BCABFF0
MDSPGYWVRQVRATVRYADAIDTARSEGVTRILEVGPDAILTPLTEGAVPAARREQSETETLIGAVAQLHTTGQRVDWVAVLPKANRIELPTYPFQHQRYWTLPPAGNGDVSAAGQLATEHPVLMAAVPAPDSDAVTFTGRLSAASQPWVVDHDILGSVLLPGAAFVDLALFAAAQTGCDTVQELALQAPLVLRDDAAVAIQVVVGPTGADGLRSIAVHSRAGDRPWTLHAEGILSVAGQPVPAVVAGAWPPAGVTPVPLDTAYDDLAVAGYRYGPAFQGMTEAWRAGDDFYATVSLPQSIVDSGAGFEIHPALLDAAMHAPLAYAAVTVDGDGPVLPFVWTGVRLHATGASTVRVRITRPGPDSLTLELTDPTGQPVASVRAVRGRAVTADQLRDSTVDDLYQIEWQPLRASVAAPVEWTAWTDLPADGPAPATVVLPCVPAGGDDPLAAAHTLADEVLGRLQGWLADPRYEGSRLVLVTHDAAADVRVAPVWGLARAAQAEHPGRFVLVDLDDRDASWEALGAALASGEPELAIQDGQAVVPRLARVAAGAAASPWDGDGTVLVTGGTSGLGALAARHLVAEHGVRHVLLTSRRGPDAPDAARVRQELTDLGATVTVAACDVSDRAALAALLAAIPAEHPLIGVVHAAGVAQNGLIDALTPDRLAAVFAAKADAAWHLHELTRDLNLKAFVLYSSAGGLVLAAGQGNYAAANVFLDALARHRRAAGLPATAMAFGLWSMQTGMTQLLDLTEQRMQAQGLPALAPEHGLALFDRALAAGAAAVVPLRVDAAVLRRRGEEIPALLRGLVRMPARRAAAGASGAATGGLAGRLAGLDAAERARFLLDLVRAQVAVVLGHDSADAVEPGRAFQDLGFDSLTAVELRNQLGTATGVRLPATLVFDYPTAQAVADHIGSLLGPATGAAATPVVRAVEADQLGEPIAIVGMGCRFPGGVATPEDLWRLLADGVDAIGA